MATLKTYMMAAGVCMAMLGTAAQAAPVVLDTGLIRMGVSDYGTLGDNGVGLVGPTGDAITPGCLCEGWGASGNGNAGHAYESVRTGMLSGLTTATVLSGSGLSAQNVVMLANGLEVIHSYSSAAGGKLFQIDISLRNTTAAVMTDVRYARTLDWDVEPGYFDDNYTTIYGGTPTGPGGSVLHTSTDPFWGANPLALPSGDANTNVTDKQGDYGSFFAFGFGDLASGASTSFTTFIGADETVDGLLAALASVGIEAYSYTTGSRQGSDGNYAPAYGYGFIGLGLEPWEPGEPGEVPEPASVALLGVALAGMVATRRRRR